MKSEWKNEWPGEATDTVDHERAPEVLKMWDRIAALKEVPDGWFRGEGRAPAERSLARAREVLGRLLVENREIGRPKVFPTPDGSVQAEWVIGTWAVEARFDHEDDSVHMEATNGSTLEERSQDFASYQVTSENVKPVAEWLLDLESAEAARV